MRTTGLAMAIAATLLAAATGARAADHQYFVTSVNEDQSVLVDLATRSKVGEVVTLDLIILQRQPSTATGSPTYWVDGMQEVDCANHRTRLMLISAYSLDRSRKASSPNAAFRPWVANNAADTQAIEAFVCRNVKNAGIRSVVDLTAYQKQYFSGEAGLADRGERGIGDARNALEDLRKAGAVPAAPAPAGQVAQAQPTTWYAFSRGDDRVNLVNRDRIIRNQALASAPSMILMRKPLRDAGTDFYWVESTVQFDCARNRVHNMISALLPLDRSQRHPAETPVYDDWTAVAPGSEGADIQGLLCNNTMATDVRRVTDLPSFGRAFLAQATAPPVPAPARPAASQTAPAASPTGPGMKPPTVATAPFYLIGGKDGGALFFKPAVAVVANGFVTVSIYNLLGEPIQTEGGFLVSWGKGVANIDCRQHLWRMSISDLANLDLTKSEPSDNTKFSDWSPVLPGTGIEQGEALMCNNRLDPRLKPVTDLVAYARQRPGTSPAPAVAKPPQTQQAMINPTTVAPTTKKTSYRMTYVGKDGGDVMDTASIKRQADMATFTLLELLAKPQIMGGTAYSWAEMTEQYDCKRHRYRNRVVAFLTPDRRTRLADPEPEFEIWDPADPKTLSGRIEAFVCRGIGAAGFEPVPDLDKFQEDLLLSIKAGVFK